MIKSETIGGYPVKADANRPNIDYDPGCIHFARPVIADDKAVVSWVLYGDFQQSIWMRKNANGWKVIDATSDTCHP
jgi:hypothetical protein